MPHNDGDDQPLVLLRRLAPEQIDRFSSRKRRPRHYMGNSGSNVNGVVHSDGVHPNINGHDHEVVDCSENIVKVNGHDNIIVNKAFQMAQHSKSCGSTNTVVSGLSKRQIVNSVGHDTETSNTPHSDACPIDSIKSNVEATKENTILEDGNTSPKIVHNKPRGRPPRNRTTETIKINSDADSKCNHIEEIESNCHEATKRTQGHEVAHSPCKRKYSSEDLEENNAPLKCAIILHEEPKKTENYGFLAGYGSFLYPRVDSLYLHTYWPVNWAYSAQSLTGHVMKKSSKEALRKIRQIVSNSNNDSHTLSKSVCNDGVPTASTITGVTVNSSTSVHPNKTDGAQLPVRRGRRKVLVPDSNKDCVIRKRIGRPPGRNKHLNGVLKGNSPRKSPRQHASTLAAKATKAKIVTVNETNINVLSEESPPSPLPPRLDASVDVTQLPQRQRCKKIKRLGGPRRRTPPPPKLCPQQNDRNGEVKLRTKHVDVVRRKVRDEQIRNLMQTQQLASIREIAEKNRQELAKEQEEIVESDCEHSPIILPSSDQQKWNAFDIDGLNNMCAQIMYEQSADKRYLLQSLPQDLVKVLQSSIVVAKSRRMGDDCYLTESNTSLSLFDARRRRNRFSRKKKQNMTGWPKEKRRKAPAPVSENVTDTELDENIKSPKKRRKSTKVQRQKLKRIKLKQVTKSPRRRQSKKVKSVVVSPRNKGGRPRKQVVVKIKNISVIKNSPSQSSKLNSPLVDEHRSTTTRKPRGSPGRPRNTPGRPRGTPGRPRGTPGRPRGTPGRPRGSVGRRRRRLKKLHNDTDTDSPSNLKHDVSDSQCIKLLKRNKRTETVESPYHQTRRRKQVASTSSWEEGGGRSKRYRTQSTAEEAFVGSQPFEQHCPSDSCVIKSTIDNDS